MKFKKSEVVFLASLVAFVSVITTTAVFWSIRFHLVHGHYFDRLFHLP